MEPTATWRHAGHVRSLLVRVLFLGLLLFAVRFSYVVTLAGETCNLGNFCFFSLRDNLDFVIPATAGPASHNKALGGGSDLHTSKDWIKAVQFYSSVFQDLVAEGYLSPASKALCVESPFGQEVAALKEIGVSDAVGVSRKASKPLVLGYKKKTDDKWSTLLPFSAGESFNFVFSGGARFDKVLRPLDLASEITRALKPQGFVVAHVRAQDEYSFNSFLALFNSCVLVYSRDLDGYDASLPRFKEIVLRKESGIVVSMEETPSTCSVPGYKRELVNKAEPLITEEPLKPWITLKRNIQNIKYLTSVADISFKSRYVYVDVGARSYGSSIGSWFRKQYPKQNRTFDVYAIEADKHFHNEYKLKKGITLLPYAAWVRNETLSFEINRDPGQDVKDKGRGMGRIQPVTSSSGSFNGEVDEIQGFDFAAWLKRTVSEKDFVVMKMDVEGTEFELIPRLFETGAICLIDEIFLECHYNRWQRCCPGERSVKYQKTYGHCLDLFTSLRDSGVLVHQWW